MEFFFLLPLRRTPKAITATLDSLYKVFWSVTKKNYHDNSIEYSSIAESTDCTWGTLKKVSKTPSKATTVKDSIQLFSKSLSTHFKLFTSHFTSCPCAWSFERKTRNEAQAVVWEAGNEGLGSCSGGSVRCSDSGDKNVACVSLRALACLQNASVLWSRHRPAWGGGWREERGAARREEHEEEGTAAVWASSLLARLLKVIIEFLCRASPPCGILLCAHYEVYRERERGKEKSWQSPMLLCSDLKRNK